MSFEEEHNISEEPETVELFCIICGTSINAGQFCNKDGCGVSVELEGDMKF